MTRAKVSIGNITDDTRLGDVHGFGSQSFTVLGVSGYNLRPGSTVKDFKTATSSFRDLKDALTKSDVNSKYVLPKFQAVWSGVDSSRSRKRKAVDDLQSADGTGIAAPPSTPAVSSSEIETSENRKDSEVNFLMAPRPVPGAPDTSTQPDIVTSRDETPEVDAMDRHAEVTATATGAVAAKVQPFVVPDQTQNLSPDDKEINAPLLVVPEATAPPITPGIAIGPSVFASRMVEPLSHEDQLAEDMLAENLPAVKANGTRDLGGDGTGALTYNSLLSPPGADSPDAGSTGGSLPTSGGSRFTSVPLAAASTPTFDQSEPVKRQDPRSASRHPFRQAGLFRDHDMAMTRSALIDSSSTNTRRIMEAAAGAATHRDDSWTRWNAATEGVAMIDMPIQSTNYLKRGSMITDTQLLGANPMQLTFSPSPFVSNSMLGPFGTSR